MIKFVSIIDVGIDDDISDNNKTVVIAINTDIVLADAGNGNGYNSSGVNFVNLLLMLRFMYHSELTPTTLYIAKLSKM